jgi:hypothetical protein
VCTSGPPTVCFSVKAAYLVAYWSAASTSIGAVVATATQVIQPVEPNDRWG